MNIVQELELKSNQIGYESYCTYNVYTIYIRIYLSEAFLFLYLFCYYFPTVQIQRSAYKQWNIAYRPARFRRRCEISEAYF